MSYHEFVPMGEQAAGIIAKKLKRLYLHGDNVVNHS